jgi:hypothetical protein
VLFAATPRPAQAQEAAEARGAAVKYLVPTERPTGRVEVFSLGAAALPVPSLIGSERCLHVRLVAIDLADDGAWLVDARDQRLVLPDGTTVAPRYARASDGGPEPRLTLRRGKSGFLDLFFAVPDGDPLWASFGWRVRLGPKQIVGTTVFERLPAPVADYSHYRPSQYMGGELVIGPFWSEPDWQGSSWLQPYRGYRDYRYVARPDGFDVHAGATAWRYRRDYQRTPRDVTVARVGWWVRMDGPDRRAAVYGWTARPRDEGWSVFADAPDPGGSPSSSCPPGSSGSSGASSSSSGSSIGADWHSN